MRPFVIHSRMPGFSKTSTILIDLDRVVSMGIRRSRGEDDAEDEITLDFSWDAGGVGIAVSSEEEAESVLASAVKSWVAGKGGTWGGGVAPLPAQLAGKVPDFLKG